MADFVSRRPDYEVSALSKSNEHKGNIGAAWLNDNGTISIKLNPFVVLSAAQDLLITLFPFEEKPKKAKTHEQEELPF